MGRDTCLTNRLGGQQMCLHVSCLAGSYLQATSICIYIYTQNNPLYPSSFFFKLQNFLENLLTIKLFGYQ